MFREKPCGLLIKNIHNALEKNANNSLKNSGLTLAQVSALVFLNDAPEKKLSLKELEKRLVIAQSTTVGIATRLKNKGLIEYEDDPNDKRIKLVKLTERGADCCKTAEANMNEAEETMLFPLNEDEREAFQALLLKVSENLNK